MSAFHAGIRTVIYGAEVLHPHEKAIAAKGKMVKRIVNQPLFAYHRILFPLALQINCAFALVRGVELARRKKQEAGSKKQEALP